MISTSLFLPTYPGRETPALNETILRKREFYEKRLAAVPAPIKKYSKLRHQEIVSRFLGANTLYDELLLCHEAGTGKTCSAVGVVESVLNQPGSRFERAVILTHSKELHEKFLNEVVGVCNPPDRYFESSDGQDEVSPALRKKRAVQKAKTRYRVSTYSTFDTSEHGRWDNTVFVLDEVHHLVGSAVYDAYVRLFERVNNRKILLLTGTPMRDQPFDLAAIMNIILPENERFPATPEEFDEAYYPQGALSEEGRVDVQERLRGRVSFLRSVPGAATRYMGRYIDGIRIAPLVTTEMSDFQARIYQQTFESDNTGWYRNAQAANLFAFEPNTEFATYFTKTRGRYHRIRPLFPKTQNMNEEQKLVIVARHSAKYAEVIRAILASPDENVFVFSEAIVGSGAIVFTECLKLFGFRSTNGNNRSNGKGFSILSQVQDDSKKVNVTIKNFNKAHNANGAFLRILIGGKRVSEGFTFRNIQQIHILQPHWNMGMVDQAIARGIRYGSHRNLPAPVTVRVFLHANISRSMPDEQLIDLLMYSRASEKDVRIRQMLRALKTAAFDCALTYERNVVRDSEDFSRECDYAECLFRCSDVVYPYTRTPEELDSRTYNVFYKSEFAEALEQLLALIFRRRFSVHLVDILYFLNTRYPDVYDDFQIIQVLFDMVRQKRPFLSRYGFTGYLHEHKQSLFLMDNICPSADAAYYMRNPYLEESVAFEALVRESETPVLAMQIDRIAALPESERASQTLRLPVAIQARFVQLAVETRSTAVAIDVLDLYADYIGEVNGEFLVTIGTSPTVLRNGRWQRAPMEQVIAWVSERIGLRQAGLIAKQTHPSGKLYLVDLTNSETPVEDAIRFGKACGSFKKSELLQFAERLGIPEDAGGIKTICASIGRTLREAGAVIYGTLTFDK